MSGDLQVHRFESRIRFVTDANLPFWSGNALRSGFGARLRELVCVNREFSVGTSEGCSSCPHKELCVYDRFYNARPPEDAEVLRKQSDISRPFSFDPPAFGRYSVGEGAVLSFTLFGNVVEYLPYFILALRNLGESGLGKGYREGYGKYSLEFIDSLSFEQRSNVFSGDMVFNNAIPISYGDLLRKSEGFRGKIFINFITPAQIKEHDRFTTKPSFRGLVSRLLFRANSLAEFHGTGMLYDQDDALEILGQCRQVETLDSKVRTIHQQRYFRGQGRKARLPPFFVGQLKYSGEISQDVMALLELGQMIHVGKMATFGNGRYDLKLG